MMAEDPVLATNCQTPDIVTTGPGMEIEEVQDTEAGTETAFLIVTTGQPPPTTTGQTMTRTFTRSEAPRKIDTPEMT